MDGAKIKLSNPTIDLSPWHEVLGTYFDKGNLTQAFTYGWDMSLLGDPDPRDATSNHPSAYDYPKTIDDYITEELGFGTLIGPLPKDLPFPVFRSPMATVPKPGTEVGKRRCHRL